MRIGFTGTRSGMSPNQLRKVAIAIDSLLDQRSVTFGTHGGCAGADIEFHRICKDREIKVLVRPGHSAKDPENMMYRGQYPDADVVYDSDTHFSRNRAIVDECDILIATPYNNNGKGGTWYTINYAKKKGKLVTIIDRDE